jgi:hypothetical protein
MSETSETPKWFKHLITGYGKSADHCSIENPLSSPFMPDANERIYGKRVRDPSLPTVEEAKILSDYVRTHPNGEATRTQVVNMATFMATKRALEGGD